MDVDATSQPYTILRIKRKRNEEPLDALVLEDSMRRKKSRGGMSVFQFAQTVEEDAWNDVARRGAIRAEVSRLSKDTTSAAPVSPTVPPKRAIINAPRRYTVIQKTPKEPVASQVVEKTDKLIPSPSSDFKLLEAVRAEPEASTIPDSDMEKIEELLKDYLKVNEIELNSDQTEDNDYVWDVFFRRQGGVATLGGSVGLLTDYPDDILGDSDSDTEPEDEADEDSNAEDNYRNDYPDDESDDDSDGFFNSASDSEGDPYTSGHSDEEWR